MPLEKQILPADNLHGQATDECKKYLLNVCNTFLWLLPARYTDEVQPIDAGHGRLLKVEAGSGWTSGSTSGRTWKSERAASFQYLSSASADAHDGTVDRCLEQQNDLGYKRFRKTGMAMTAGGLGDENPTSEGVKLQ